MHEVRACSVVEPAVRRGPGRRAGSHRMSFAARQQRPAMAAAGAGRFPGLPRQHRRRPRSAEPDAQCT
ncbi:hypothetical protein G6F57_018373 [Rhizopus arrhizus]|nr:hypothetical protein G6F32_017199 [Rhizopus arrhizus]KAG1240950.1 hypothetical protein G6F68_017163 [Rhizopus microsporus]KAG1259588.1 hypothetical protein G6F65_015276 [Rhizopus arrhizus]KAG1442547.1 hypothetical protein G6F57_018373 [Rhizopus arrhizus]KAG1478474.1 hypothetical protein G6F54_013981 [Rhizopus delemar]